MNKLHHTHYLPNQFNFSPQADHEDLERLYEYDLEEMDLEVQSGQDLNRMKRHFARECRIKGTQDNRRRDAWNSRNKDGSRTGQKEDSKALNVNTKVCQRLLSIKDFESDSEDECKMQIELISGKMETAVKEPSTEALKKKGIVYSGCSRHKTETRPTLLNFQYFNGWPLLILEVVNVNTGKNLRGKEKEANEEAKSLRKKLLNKTLRTRSIDWLYDVLVLPLRPDDYVCVMLCSKFQVTPNNPTQILTMLEGANLDDGNPNRRIVIFLAETHFLALQKAYPCVNFNYEGKNMLLLTASCCWQDFVDSKSIVLKIHTDDNVADLLTKAFDVALGGSVLVYLRESIEKRTDGTEALLIPTLFILWLDKVSTDSAKLVPLGKVCTAIETLKKNTAKIPEIQFDHIETKNAQDEGMTRDIVDKDKEIEENVLSIEDVLSTDKDKVSTDEQNEGTEEHIEGILEEQIESTTDVSREKEKGVELKDIEEADRPRPTSTRSLLTLKPLPKIDPKDKGKKKIEEMMILKGI
ncbi:hypothetical protein Tco_0627853 [Tanacetum coccineum]|uniref:Uncharacterized protein n=1 Tax=Tanacetum coccineum TaxID=301880 RepID=A0ABQ4WNM0_9ASTR